MEKPFCNAETSLPEEICVNVKEVTMRHPQGLSYHMFWRAYEDIIGIDLDVRQLGLNSLEAFFQQLSNQKIIQLNYENNNIVVKPHDAILKNMSFMQKWTDKDRISRPRRREDVIGAQDKILQQVLPPDLKVGDFLEVIIAEVFNPSRFWIQLKGEVTSKMLDNIMDEMEDFYYSDSGDQYKVPVDCVVVGLMCASLYNDGNWHRALVKSMLDLSTVEVFYLDYGTIATVKKDSLRYLHKRFGDLPGQAIEAKLAGIKPEGGLRRFTEQTSTRFLELVKMPPDIVGLLAVVKGLGPKLMLWLVDTATNQIPEGIAINQVLVDEGLAEPDVLMDVDPVLHQKRPVVNHLAPLRRPVITSKSEDMGFSTDQTLVSPSATKTKKTAVEEIQSKMEMLDSWIKSSQDPGVIGKLEILLQTHREEMDKLKKELKLKQVLATPPGEMKTAKEMDNTTKEMKGIQPMNLTGYKVHVVVLDKMAWMTSFQISKFVPNWKGRDILTRMLKLKRMSVESVLVTSENHPALYKAMVEGGLGGESMGVGLMMYAIKSLPHILNIFLHNHPTELKEELQKEIKRFEVSIL